MHNALVHTLQDAGVDAAVFSRAVLTGTDIPDISSTLLESALHALLTYDVWCMRGGV